MSTRGGEKSEYSDITVRSISPAINIQLQPSYKDSSLDADIPDPFRARPRLSRTPPNTNDQSDDIKTSGHEYITDTLETYQSDKINSPSLSIEYPPGSSIPMVKKRKKFQFKKSHYQRFIGTSSAKKTKEIRKTMEREKISRSNSLISYQSSAAVSFPAELIETSNHSTNDIKHNITSTLPINQDSMPPTPPSDDLLSQIMNKSLNKPQHLITANSVNVIVPVLPSDKSVNSDDISVSSSPSLLEETNTTTLTHNTTTCNKTKLGYSYRYRSRQKWKTLIHDDVQKRQQKTSTHRVFSSSRANYRPKKGTHMNFGAKTKPKIDPDQIRIRLHEYDEQNGQNLEEIFRPQKTCWCNVL